MLKSFGGLTLGLLLLTVGCSSSAPPSNSGPSSPPPSPQTAAPAPTVEANAFASIPEAVASLSENAAASKREEWSRASQWLQMQGAPAVPPLETVLNDPSADIRAHIAVVRTLSGLGSAAEPVLLAAIRNHPNEKVRLNAIDQIGYLRPSSKVIVDELIGLMDHEDDEIRRSAVSALGAVGTPAAAAKDKLLAILQSTEENDYLRKTAKASLEKVNPRRTFQD